MWQLIVELNYSQLALGFGANFKGVSVLIESKCLGLLKVRRLVDLERLSFSVNGPSSVISA